MKRRLLLIIPILIALIIALPSCLLRPPQVAVPKATGLVLEDVTVIHPALGRESGRRLTIDGDRIRAVDASTAVDTTSSYRGMYVLPGLVDMHTHFPNKLIAGVRESASLLYLAHGVTTIRDTGTVGGDPIKARRDIRAGRFPGPRIFLCGPVIDGDPPSHPLSTPVKSPEEAGDLVDSLAAEGEVDCIKVYTRLSSESLHAVREAAARHKLPLLGHVPVAVTLGESGLNDSQHLYGIGEKLPMRSFGDSWGAWDTVDSARVDEVIAVSLEKDIAHTPTLIVFDKLSRVPELSASPEEAGEVLPLIFRDLFWDPQKGLPAVYGLEPPDYARLRDAMPRMRQVVAQMYQSGVRLHIGSDDFMPYVSPGKSLIEEMEQFVLAGIPLENVWAIATRDAGAALGVPLLGRIEANAPADLLVFREDPTKDLAAIDSLELVIANGRVYAKADIDAALARHGEFVRTRRYRATVHPFFRMLYALIR